MGGGVAIELGRRASLRGHRLLAGRLLGHSGAALDAERGHRTPGGGEGRRTWCSTGCSTTAPDAPSCSGQHVRPPDPGARRDGTGRHGRAGRRRRVPRCAQGLRPLPRPRRRRPRLADRHPGDHRVGHARRRTHPPHAERSRPRECSRSPATSILPGAAISRSTTTPRRVPGWSSRTRQRRRRSDEPLCRRHRQRFRRPGRRRRAEEAWLRRHRRVREGRRRRRRLAREHLSRVPRATCPRRSTPTPSSATRAGRTGSPGSPPSSTTSAMSPTSTTCAGTSGSAPRCAAPPSTPTPGSGRSTSTRATRSIVDVAGVRGRPAVAAVLPRHRRAPTRSTAPSSTPRSGTTTSTWPASEWR